MAIEINHNLQREAKPAVFAAVSAGCHGSGQDLPAEKVTGGERGRGVSWVAVAGLAAGAGDQPNRPGDAEAGRGSKGVQSRRQGSCAQGLIHCSQTAANRLTYAALDPVCGIPEFKVCAVRLEKAA